jgi:hypothetical protein
MNQSNILLKDAVYSAIQLGAYNLYDFVDFDAWFLNKLSHEALLRDPSNEWLKILRRRVCLLISGWINVKCSPETKPTIYKVLLSLCDPAEDLVVRLTAIAGLKSVVEEGIISDAAVFEQFADLAVGLLCEAMEEVEEYDTRVSILNTLSSVVTMMGPMVIIHH